MRWVLAALAALVLSAGAQAQTLRQEVLVRGVLKGIEMARKHQMPEVVIDFIRTHHGTTKVDYFYNLAVKDNPDKVIDESIFKYPGPVPFSKETAVLMMADSVEASSLRFKLLINFNPIKIETAIIVKSIIV